MTPSLRFLKKGVLRKLEVSHGKKLGLGTFLNSHSIFSEWSPGKTSKITFDCLFTKPMPSALQWCMISIFWKKRFWENWRWAMARSWGWAFFFNSDSHFSERSQKEDIWLVIRLAFASNCPVMPNVGFLKQEILRKLQASQIKNLRLGNWDWKKL